LAGFAGRFGPSRDAAGEHSRFDELTWSGKNRASASQAAASEISSVVQNIQSTLSNEKIFIIGHSHGGSAAEL
jgi:predicted esterase